MRYKDVAKKNVYIVGGSEGIGLETALILAGMDANILLFSRNEKKLRYAVEQVESKRVSDTQNFSYIPLDITDNARVISVMETAVKDFGKVDILINCAGKATPRRFEDIDYTQFDETVKINLYGVRNTIAALLPYLKEKGGMIVNVSSMVGFIGVFGYTDYAASKFGVIGFSEALKSEVKWHNIDVRVLCPPDTDTPGYKEENKTKPPETKAISAAAKIRSARYVAEALVKGMKRKKFLIIPGFDSGLSYFIKHLLPSLGDFFMDTQIKKARKGQQD